MLISGMFFFGGVSPGGMLILPGFSAHFIEVEAVAKDKRVAVRTVRSVLLASPSDAAGDRIIMGTKWAS